MRVFGSKVIKADYGGTAENAVDAIKELKALENNFYQCNTVKLFMDGVPEANTALLEEPYCNEPENSGDPQWNLGKFNEICTMADKKGYQIHVHAIGDRAVRFTLDGFECARNKNGKRDARHMIAHVQLIQPDQVDRIRKLAVTVVPTAFWFEKGDLYYQVELLSTLI